MTACIILLSLDVYNSYSMLFIYNVCVIFLYLLLFRGCNEYTVLVVNQDVVWKNFSRKKLHLVKNCVWCIVLYARFVGRLVV